MTSVSIRRFPGLLCWDRRWSQYFAPRSCGEGTLIIMSRVEGGSKGKQGAQRSVAVGRGRGRDKVVLRVRRTFWNRTGSRRPARQWSRDRPRRTLEHAAAKRKIIQGLLLQHIHVRIFRRIHPAKPSLIRIRPLLNDTINGIRRAALLPSGSTTSLASPTNIYGRRCSQASRCSPPASVCSPRDQHS